MEYARARTGIGLGDGSDISRIKRQQGLLTALVKEVLRKNIIGDIPQLYSLASAAISNLQSSYGITDLVGIAYSMRGIKTYNIGTLTVPWGSYPQNPNRVQWTADAAILWQELITDKPVTVGEIKYMAERPPGVDPLPTGTPTPKPTNFPSGADSESAIPNTETETQPTEQTPTPTPTPTVDPKNDPTLDACVL
jgi:hypothetical protein